MPVSVHIGLKVNSGNSVCVHFLNDLKICACSLMLLAPPIFSERSYLLWLVRNCHKWVFRPNSSYPAGSKALGKDLRQHLPSLSRCLMVNGYHAQYSDTGTACAAPTRLVHALITRRHHLVLQ